ncbi:MAG: SAM-dependent methyltransferase [Candidatus Viridilinea halotolerans]|uniref:SAM-dependent methyltransferase n=1 Tax=Candidatus Viridilinea halotolerans TaxID=2491704 RepID=A0A426TSC3_9CHLR|nr:MAG: SAM-dependent methyltransferase [Candidatus Viridilinea halotolerans]
MSPLPSDYPRYAWQMLTGQRAAKEAETHAQRMRDLQPWLDLGRPLDILDVGNGSLRPQYALLRGAGHRVTGIDFVNQPALGWKAHAYRLLRGMYALQLGLGQAAMEPTGLLKGNVGVLPFPDATFDLAVSYAAFEHFLEIPKVLTELQRVLRSGGLLWVGIHLFTSPSGGHNVSFTEYPLRTLPPGTEPWDHLRKRRRPFTVPLNQWRKQQYLAAFAHHFEVLHHYCALREGEQWLTPDLQVELADYSRDELTCATLVLVAAKR